MSFRVRLTRDAETDVDRLFDFLMERELSRDGGDLTLPTQAIAALRSGVATLNTSPFTCRKAVQSPFLRELIVPFGRSSHVALFEIEDDMNVAVLAMRHQMEGDCHSYTPGLRCGQASEAAMPTTRRKLPSSGRSPGMSIPSPSSYSVPDDHCRSAGPGLARRVGREWVQSGPERRRYFCRYRARRWLQRSKIYL